MQTIVQKEDITKIRCDAIVNPANRSGYMGGGVAGVIKRVGGSTIEREAINQAPIPIGKAVITTAGTLPCKAVIHAPTMRRPAEKTNEQNIQAATLAALECADKNGFQSIAFPGMGTGVGRVPLDIAARAMVGVIKSFQPKSLKKVYLIGISDDIINAFNKEFQSPSSNPPRRNGVRDHLNGETISILREQLLKGVTINLRISTDSMLPLIEPGDIILVKGCPYSDLCKGEIILYQRGNQLFGHRIIAKHPLTPSLSPVGRGKGEGNSSVTITKADMSLEPDKIIEKEEYMGKVVALKKKNKVINLDTRYWRRINSIAGYISLLEYTVFRILHRWKLKFIGTRQGALNRYIKNSIILGFKTIHKLLAKRGSGL